MHLIWLTNITIPSCFHRWEVSQKSKASNTWEYNHTGMQLICTCVRILLLYSIITSVNCQCYGLLLAGLSDLVIFVYSILIWYTFTTNQCYLGSIVLCGIYHRASAVVLCLYWSIWNTLVLPTDSGIQANYNKISHESTIWNMWNNTTTEIVHLFQNTSIYSNFLALCIHITQGQRLYFLTQHILVYVSCQMSYCHLFSQKILLLVRQKGQKPCFKIRSTSCMYGCSSSGVSQQCIQSTFYVDVFRVPFPVCYFSNKSDKGTNTSKLKCTNISE